MQQNKLITSVMALAIGLTASKFASAQSTTDHPNLKSNSARTGANADVLNSGPGFLNVETFALRSSLRWFRPNLNATPVTALRLNEVNGYVSVIDNTDNNAPANFDENGNAVGPYDPQPSGFTSLVGGWNVVDSDGEARGAYRLPVRRNPNLANPPGFTGTNPNSRFPSHLWAPTTSSASGVNQDPRITAVPGTLRTFSWTFTPKFSTYDLGTDTHTVFNDTTPKGYAISVWLPVGPVSIGINKVFPQKFFAYEITYGIGQKYVDIVDTQKAGNGWVRLGNGGRPTNQLFNYSGNPAFPITIKLLNTIPRDEADRLLENVTIAEPDSRLAVFADAARFSTESDSYYATPTSAGFGTPDVRVTAARNERTIDPTTIPPTPTIGNSNFKEKPLTIGKGVVTSYDYNTGNVRWRFSPQEDGPDTKEFDAIPEFVLSGGIVSLADNPLARGGTYFSTPTITGLPAAATENVTVNPTTNLANGDYELYMFVGGNTVPGQYPVGSQYEIFEGLVSQGVFTLDASSAAGYKQLGNARYTHSTANRLSIVFYNTSSNVADLGKPVYVDQVRFVGGSGTEIKSTPVHASARIRTASAAIPVATNIVLIADERGRLHCVDANGNGDGTTNVYWTYPSIRSAATDPNINVGLDPTDPINQEFDGINGAVQAVEQSRFNLSTAVIRTLTVPGPSGAITRDYLFIASDNGRVNCIAMEGRGDQDFTTKTPGTTFRRWTYPETFPSNSPKNGLGAITSLTAGTIATAGTPEVIFAATDEGRVFCLDARGNFLYNGTSKLNTDVVWTYPLLTNPTLNGIVGAPTYDEANGRLFFGTLNSDGLGSQLVSLDTSVGAPFWNNVTDTLPGRPNLLSWRAGTAYVPASELNSLAGPGAIMPDTVFAMNENGYVYAINANNGDVIWRTNELQSGGEGSLAYTNLTAYDSVGALVQRPVVLVPTASGKFAALFARINEETRFLNRLAWGYELDSAIEASMTVSNKWMFGATSNGFLLAWSDLANGGVVGGGGGPGGPGGEIVPDNDQDSNFEQYRNTEVAFINREAYVRLRKTQAGGGIRANENFGTIIDAGGAYTKPNGRVQPPFRSTHGTAFEWGETIYLIAYNFPVRLSGLDSRPVPPPVVQLTATTEGRASRPIVSEGRLFLDKAEGDPDGGYAIFAIPLTAGGASAQTPGPGSITAVIRTSSTNRNNVQQSITLNPQKSGLSYQVANPIGIAVADDFASAGADIRDQIGYTVNASRSDALSNGSIATLTNAQSPNLGRSVGLGAHGGSKRKNVYVFDRSLITLLRGEGKGLDLVRVDRRDLAWQNGAGAAVKQLSTLPGVGALYSAFEELPTNFPNRSLDYPNIARERVRVTKDPNGNAENPVFNSISLRGPRTVAGQPVDESTAGTRVLAPTVFQMQVDFPRFQPANSGVGGALPDQLGNTSWFAGYAGRYTVYVDSDQSGTFSSNGTLEAYRTFNLAAAVSPDERIVIGTPNVDLGSLAGGTGYDARLTYNAARPYRLLSGSAIFNPSSVDYEKMFKPFTAFNEGNVNLLNVRLAKGTFSNQFGNYNPWQIFAADNNDSIWLDAATDVHSDIDLNFAPINGAQNFVIIQKPRVGDNSGRQLKVNPSSRLNPNIANSGRLLDPTRPGLNRDPRVGISVPFGMPVGQYSQKMRLIEDTNSFLGGTQFNDESMSLAYSAATGVFPTEAFSDPTFTLSFGVKETQLTGGSSRFTEAVVDPGTPVTRTNPVQWADSQPTGIRHINGNLVVAFASNRPVVIPAVANPNPNNRNTRIYVGVIPGSTLGAPDGRSQDSNIRDLNQFVPGDVGNRRWWSPQAIVPSEPDASLFANTLTSGVTAPINLFDASNVMSDFRYGNPVMPVQGARVFATATIREPMAFVGTAKRLVEGTLVDDSRIMVSQVDNTGAAGPTAVLDADPLLAKGRPTIVRVVDGLYGIFYPVLSNGVTTINYVQFSTGSNTFSVPVSLRFGNGFESVSSPSASVRSSGNASFLEVSLTFTGRVRGSSNSEVFIARVRDANTSPRFIEFGVAGAFNAAGRAEITEVMTFDGKTGGFRTRGLSWQGDYDIRLNGNLISNSIIRDAAGNLLSASKTDRDTKLQVLTTSLNIPVTVDRELGLVKFGNTSLPKGSALTVTYNPLFLRLSSNQNAGYSTTSMLFDSRLSLSNDDGTSYFWKTPSGAIEPASSTNTRSDRFMLTAVRSSQAGGQNSRPVMSTFRLGVRLGFPLPVNPDGTVTGLTVTGNTGSYQVDPVGGRIFFTTSDEDRRVRVIYGAYNQVTTVSLIGETIEDFVPVSNPLNENGMFTFMDPMDSIGLRRGMVWMLWSSTRNGAPSIYMQGYAKRLGPFLPR
jgi:hypothetical protein